MAEREGERIYVRNEAGGLEPLREERFGSEATLQELLADYPELLEGTQIQPKDPRRWILITREQGIPMTLGAGDRWSVDHLVIDQDAVPTLVEVKRGDSTQLRREVVGQMLDYAAHAKFISAEKVQETFEHQPDAEEQLAELIKDKEIDPDTFWEMVADNLKDRNIRLLFVADAIPDELAHIVEFLNEKMRDIQVLAVEIKQFRGKTLQTLVPRVIGRLAKENSPGRSTSGGPRPKLTRELLFEELEDHVRGAATRLLEVAKTCDGHLAWGASSVTIRATSADGVRYPITLIYRPSAAGVSGERHFVFGSSTTEPTGELRAFLDKWTSEFRSDGFTERTPWDRWRVSYDDAVANIDLLADRLRTALTEIPKLSNDG